MFGYKMLAVITFAFISFPFTNLWAGGGSGIGGGVIYSQADWSDSAVEIIESARNDATQHVYRTNDQSQGLEILQQGFINASSVKGSDLLSSLTFKTLQRGLTLSEMLKATGGNLSAAYSILDWYARDILKGSHSLDRDYNFPLLSEQEISREKSSREFGDLILKHSSLQLRGVQRRLGALKDSPAKYFEVLGYMSTEIAGDLSQSIFGDNFVCQAVKLKALNEEIQQSRNSGVITSETSKKILSLRFEVIIQEIESGICSH